MIFRVNNYRGWEYVRLHLKITSISKGSRHCPPPSLPPPPHYHHYEDLENMYVLEIVVRYEFLEVCTGPHFFNFNHSSPKAFGLARKFTLKCVTLRNKSIIFNLL